MSEAGNRICCGCIHDEYLRQVVITTGLVLRCDYCCRELPTIDVWDLARRCDDVIRVFFEVTSLASAVVDFDRDPEGEPLDVVLDALLGLPGKAREDLIEVLEDHWFDRHTHEREYGEDPWFIESNYDTAAHYIEWMRMQESLRDTSRFFNPAASAFLQKIFGPLLEDRTVSGDPVIVKAGPGHAINSFFRARSCDTENEVEFVLGQPESELGPPPSGKGSAGRMNCEGIPVFYGATSLATAIAEVRPPVGAYVVAAAFHITREVNLLDLTRLGALSLGNTSKFDSIAAERATRRNFLQTLVSRLTLPVLPGQAKNDYIVTQAIADFLATHPRLDLDGILFPSTQAGGTDSPSLNVVIFRKSSSVQAPTGLSPKAIANLYEYGDGDRPPYFSPTLESIAVPSDEDFSRRGIDRLDPPLRLDRASISINIIRGISYESSHVEVAHTISEQA